MKMDLSDVEIREALAPYEQFKGIPIDSSTRPVLLSKIVQLTQQATTVGTGVTAEILSAQRAGGANMHSPAETLPIRQAGGGAGVQVPVEILPSSKGINHSTSGPLLPSREVNEVELYVLVIDTTIPSSQPSIKHYVKQIYTCKDDALNAMKHVPGARFRKFDAENSAHTFMKEQIEVLDRVDSNANCAEKKMLDDGNIEKANSYHAPKTQDLNNFRKMIENNDLQSFAEAVWRNPCYLITQGDYPQILKPPVRYNALHCAVKGGCLEICQKLFEILEGDRFWNLVYPSDSCEVRHKRRSHLVDQYLNMQEKGHQETPLHLACKYGHEDIVAYLLTFPALDTNTMNKYEQTAYKITCKNEQNYSESKQQQIYDLLNAPAIYFVPVFRALDNSIHPKLSIPCTLQELETRQKSPLMDNRGTPVISSAIAGPMSPLQAETFYKEWRSPSQTGERKEAINVKRSDPDRGLERIGRQLAHQQKVGWKEYWDFIASSCDLSKSEGQQALEEYLSNLNPEASSSDEILADLVDTKLDLNGSPFTTPKKDPVPNQTFLTGSEPTKLDYDVMLALGDCHINKATHPCLAHWLEIVRSYTEDEQKCWRTPSKQHFHHTPSKQHSHSWHTPSTRHTTPLRHISSRSQHRVTPARLF